MPRIQEKNTTRLPVVNIGLTNRRNARDTLHCNLTQVCTEPGKTEAAGTRPAPAQLSQTSGGRQTRTN